MDQKKKVIRTIVLGSLLPWLFIAILFLMPFDKEFAYHFVKNECDDKGAWIYNRIFSNPEKIDVAFVGSSRIKASIWEDKLEKSFRKEGLTLKVANLGYCRWGRNLEYVIVKDLLNHKHPKLLVIELHEEEERLSHIDFAWVADSKDVLLPVMFFNQEFFKDVFHAAMVRVEFFKQRLLYGKPKFPKDTEDHGYRQSKEVIDPVVLSDILYKDSKKKHYTEGNLEHWINKQFPLKYLDKIVQMANDHGCKVSFLYMPQYGSVHIAHESKSYYSQYGRVLVPPQNIMDSITNWRDVAHFNDNGAEKLSVWLSHEIADTAR